MLRNTAGLARFVCHQSLIQVAEAAAKGEATSLEVAARAAEAEAEAAVAREKVF